MKKSFYGFARFLSVVCVLFSALAASHAASKNYLLYVGTYTNTGSKGIYVYRYDAKSDKVVPLGLAAETVIPSFLAISPGQKFLYAVNEVSDYKSEPSGGVTAFAIDRQTGKLKQLNEVASRGADPCYIALDKSGKYVLVANYNGGNVAAFPLSADGHIGEASSVVQDEGGAVGPNKERQEKAHAHWIETSARNRFAYVSDLGLDRVLIYEFDADTGKLARGESGGSPDAKDFFSAILAPGSGPRHVAFSGDG